MAEILIADALTINQQLRSMGVLTKVPAAITATGVHPRRRLDQVTLDDLLQVANAPEFAADSPLYPPLVRLMTHVLVNAGYITEVPETYQYRTDHRVPIDELATLMLNPYIKLPTREDLGGDYATIETFKTAMPHVIRDLVFLDSLRAPMLAKLRLGIGNIGFKTRTGQPLDQFEKSLLVLYGNTQSGLGSSSLIDNTPIQAKENADPLVQDALRKAAEASMLGPDLRFNKLISSQNPEALLYYFGRHVPTLPLNIGHLLQRGPFSELHFEPMDEKPWSAASIMAGIRDFQASTNVAKEVADLGVQYAMVATPPMGWRTTTDGKEYTTLMHDLPSVKVLVIDEADCAKTRWEYFSKYRDRVVEGGNGRGGSTETLLLDLALTNKELGDSVTDALTLSHVKLLDKPDETIQARLINAEEIVDKVYYVKGGTFQEAEVPMRWFYYRLGKTIEKPSLCEWVTPPISWFHVPAEAAVQYLNARLSLTREEQLQNVRALTISHNASEIERLLGAPVAIKTREYIKAILGFKQ